MSLKQIETWFETLWKKLFGPKPKLAMLGDSLIANLATTNQQSTLPEPFKNAMNLGMHGDTTAQISTRIPKIPAGLPVLLEGGANNISLGSQDQVVPNYTAMLDALSSHRVILLGIVQWDETVAAAGSNAKISALNSQINALAIGRPNVVVATDAQALSMVGLTIDGEHPSPAGYIALVNKLLPLV